MSRGIVIALGLVAGCISLAVSSARSQVRAAQERIESLMVVPPWSPCLTMPNVLPGLGDVGPLSAEEFDFDAADALPLNAGRYSRYVYPSNPCS